MVYASQRILSGQVLIPGAHFMDHRSATVSAAANIALIKYWGKTSDANGHSSPANLPATGSVSLGMEDLRTTTTLSFAEGASDTFESSLDEAAQQRIVRFLDRLRERFDCRDHFHINTQNNFPTGTGLASSASGFAALTLAFNALLKLDLNETLLSQLARSGSGSAARSIFGGYVEVVLSDDAHAQQIIPAESWPLDIVVAVTNSAAKAIGSTQAMQRTAQTSPYYEQWLSSHSDDMQSAKNAISAKDFDRLAEVSEHNCLKMHATIMTAQPPVLYWLPATLAVMHEVTAMRAAGIPAFYSIDAGAQVKIICEPTATDTLLARLKDLAGVTNLIQTRVGGSPQVHLT